MSKLCESCIDQKYRGKYRVPSARLRGYDYGQNGAYFITICTRDRQSFFGEITNGEMRWSEMGKIAGDSWRQIPDHFPFVILGQWIVMPNHVHGVIMIDKNDDSVETPNLGVSTLGVSTKNQTTENPYWKPRNLGVMINQYKRACTIGIRKSFPDFAWQPRFYDRIIRDEEELNRISEYIISNPQSWNTDDYFPKTP